MLSVYYFMFIFFLSRKKLSKFSQHPNWKNASNYVAKRYIKEVPNETYFDDVKLQMDSKLWGEEYSKLNIPKKVGPGQLSDFLLTDR